MREECLVRELARPGGDVPGVGCIPPELAAKRLELLREASPSLRRAGIVWHAGDPAKVAEFAAARDAAAKLGLAHVSCELRTAGDFDAALTAVRVDGIDGEVIE